VLLARSNSSSVVAFADAVPQGDSPADVSNGVDIELIWLCFAVQLRKLGKLRAFFSVSELCQGQICIWTILGQRFLGSNHIRQRRRVCKTKCG
jgi:hypothetical protein